MQTNVSIVVLVQKFVQLTQSTQHKITYTKVVVKHFVSDNLFYLPELMKIRYSTYDKLVL